MTRAKDRLVDLLTPLPSGLGDRHFVAESDMAGGLWLEVRTLVGDRDLRLTAAEVRALRAALAEEAA